MTVPPDNAPTIVWFRRDLRLADHPALAAAASEGPVIPVFVLDPETEALGAAHRWRLGRALERLEAGLHRHHARLILRRGEALETLRLLIAETGARGVVWSRLYDGASRERDARVKAALKADGIEARSFNGSLLFEPWTVETGSGGFYKVYTPYWRAVEGREPPGPVEAPSLRLPEAWPASLTRGDLALGADMDRGGPVVARYVEAGEDAARERLEAFLAEDVRRYPEARDRLDLDATSGLSDHLAVGEISPRQIWAAAAPMRSGPKGDAVTGFLQEIVWREFAYHLLHHTPEIETENWRSEWDAFPWRGDNADAERWRRGRTGQPVVDAAMRELYVTGTMHNRMRMLTASYLTKHLMTHWRVGEAWFRETLVDWDPASNSMGWQWAAGSGPDASPFFRIFNPETQGKKFDPEGRYRARWVAELNDDPGRDALAFFEAIPRSWGMTPSDPYPAPMVDLKRGRERALEAYSDLKSRKDGASA